jgi:hypothetical protein
MVVVIFSIQRTLRADLKIYEENFGELDFVLSLHRASDNHTICEDFVKGHRQLLAVNGVDLGPIDSSWFNSKNVFLLVVRRINDGEILGGSKLVIYDGDENLPLLKLLKDDYPELLSYLREFQNGGLVEISGLWNSRSVAGLGLGSEQLIRTSIAISGMLNVETVITFCSPFVTRFAELYGFVPLSKFGTNGSIPFPDERWLSTINILEDPMVMSKADLSEKEIIFDLRANPSQMKDFDSRGKQIKIKFELSI